MNTQYTTDAVNALDYPEAAADGMVYQVWEDGEITLQKGGGLLWQRTLHCIASGDSSKALPGNALLHKCNGHSYIFAASNNVAEAARELILKHGV